jgi:hypothetical protein
VYPAPPRLHLPQDLGANIRWHVKVRRSGDDTPPAGRVVGPADPFDLWEGIPRPVLGSFEITVRGPLGRGLRRTIFIAEGLSAAYHPEVRPLTGAGLATGSARLTAATDATAQPAALHFGSGERANVIVYRTDAGAEQLVITPPHAAVMCSGAGATTWTTSQIHLVAEEFAKAGRLLVRFPASGRPGPVTDNGHPSHLELAVLVRGQQVQAIEPSGLQPPGLAGFELSRAADTIAAYGRAELAVGVDGMLMPVGYVRPRRLAGARALSAG